MELDGVELDYCCACRGVWFDAGELDVLVTLAGGDPQRLRGALGAAPAGRSRRRCLRCGRRLATLTVARDGPTVQIERCGHGHGFWLDAGELELVAQAATGGAATPEGRAVATFLADLFRHQLGDPAKG